MRTEDGKPMLRDTMSLKEYIMMILPSSNFIIPEDIFDPQAIDYVNKLQAIRQKAARRGEDHILTLPPDDNE